MTFPYNFNKHAVNNFATTKEKIEATTDDLIVF